MTGAIKPIERPDAVEETLTAEDVATCRKFCDWVALWRHCAEPACWRAHRCVGDPIQCFGRFYNECPKPVRVWLQAGMSALEIGSTARFATRVADAALLKDMKAATRLPPGRRKRRKQRRQPV